MRGYKNNFVIEKVIKCHKNLRDLNPSSCNTIRVHTFRNKETEQIEYVSSYVRIGKSGEIIDNSSTGGITCGIKDGKLMGHACMMNPNYNAVETTGTGIKLEGYEIYKFDEILETCVNAHSCLPFFGLIGWDITVDENDQVVIIEYNPNPGMKIGQLALCDTPLLDKQEAIIRSFFN